VPHCAFDAHWALQLPDTLSQMPLRHCRGALQGWALGTPQVPATHALDAHWAAAVQAVPLVRRGVQVPLEQKLDATHWLSAVQVGPQAPLAQAPTRH
jgi:hypothetical protein